MRCILITLAFTAGCIPFPLHPIPWPGPHDSGAPSTAGEVWTADRAEGAVSVLDVDTMARTATLILPDDGEPMYINYSARAGAVLVGDRANNRVVAIDPNTRAVLGTAPAGAGVFHQWALPHGDQLWINNDIDRTTTVLDIPSFATLATIPMPMDLAAMPGDPKPHDVLIAPEEDAAYVTYLGFSGDNDYVVRFDTTTFAETHRAVVGKDPHLTATPANDWLYVPCQNTDELIVLDRMDLSPVTTLAIPGAHGITISPSGDRVYITNLPGAGVEGLFVVDASNNQLITSMGLDVPLQGSPHNLAVSVDGSTLFLTHSGPTSTLVTAYDLAGPLPSLPVELDVGLNPFGLGAVP